MCFDWLRFCCAAMHFVLFHRWTQCCVDRIGNAHFVTDVWTHIESRQFIGWWRDAISDAMTSSAHTGERAIHSSDFSAFTKRSHYPSLLRFSGPTYLLRSSICTSATASVELCSPRGEVPWSFAAVNRRARVSSLVKTHTVSALSAWGFRMHVTRFMGPRNARFATISVS